jgi:hypothetical protein
MASTNETVTVPVDVEDLDRLTALFGAETVRPVLDVILKAGAMEAVGYASGRAVFTTMADLRAFRVYCLVTCGLGLEDSEKLVASLFKVTPAGARRLVTSALARYRYELDTSVTKEIERILDDASWVADDIDRWEVRLPPGFVRDRVLELCRSGDQPNPESKRGAVWHFAEETYDQLRADLDLPERPVPDEL